MTKDKKTKKTSNKAKTPKESFIKSVHKEMKLVKWPTWKEVIKNTIATVVLCAVVVLFFMLLTLLLAKIKEVF